MLTINKLRCDSAIDYAAEELKKYLRMMMPECGDIKIFYNPEAKDGFRLGFLEDFSIPFEGEDADLDDVIHVDTTTEGGILAGSNPRSVLFSVYRFLKENGCRWLYPGIDGEYIPMKDIEPVSYHKVPDNRLRGFCDEGSPSQGMMLEWIEWAAKLELNAFSLEFFLPNGYYNAYYSHVKNEKYRKAEPVSDEQILQWRRQCEVEVNKRGLRLFSIGHGWTCRALGFPSEHRPVDINDFTEEQRGYIALRDGKREFYCGIPVLSQICMSNAKVRSLIADYVVEFSKNHENITDIAFSLGDSPNAQCECEECVKMSTTDWQVMVLNEIDEKMTAAGLNTRIAPNIYLDTFFPPEQVKFKNPKRFSYLYSPITRDYTSSITEDTVIPPSPKFEYNNFKMPSTEELYALLKDWQKVFAGDILCFEYHFWRSQYIEPGQQNLARRLYEDVKSLRIMGIDGMLEDASQKSGFPNGFMAYIYAETMMNCSCDFDEVREDYFKHIYGQRWDKVLKVLQRISDIFDIAYMQNLYQSHIHYKELDEQVVKDLSRLPKFQRVHDLAAELRYHYERKGKDLTRVQTVFWNVLWYFAEYMDYYADMMIYRCQGQVFKSRELVAEFINEFAKHELEIERFYDHPLAMESLFLIQNQLQVDLPLE